MTELSPALALLIPFVGALGVGMAGRWPNLRETVTLVTAGVLLVVVASFVPRVLAGDVPTASLVEVVPGIELELEIEPLGMIYALLASFLWIFNSIYSIGYMRAANETGQTRFYICFCLAIASVMGIAFSANLFTLFLFYEVLTFSTFPLVTHKRSPEAVRSGRIYLGILVGTSTLFLLLAVVWTAFLADTVDFAPGGILAGRASPGLITLLFTLFVLGTGKAAVMPFHFWLPAAMVAPTPVSALLHAVAVVKAGVFIVLKIAVYVVGLDTIAELGAGRILSYMAAGTILIGATAAILQDNLKARLAYSTISQLSYIVLAATLGSSVSALGGGMHIVMHGFAKITLFFCAGAIYVTAKKTKVSELTGIGRVMPLTMAAFTIGALSNVGVPPFGGAWSKWYLSLGTLDADQVVFLGVYLVASLLGVAYLIPIPVKAFFCSEKESLFAGQPVKEAPIPCLIALCVTASGCIVLFLRPDMLFQLLEGVS